MKINRILIYLHATQSPQMSWVMLDEHNKILESVYQGNIDEFKNPANDAEVFVIVPSQDIILSEVTLPKLSKQRLLQAIPFALEEHLIDDVETLHFAWKDYLANKTLPVAIVSHVKMTEWLDFLKTLNVTPQAFIPSVFLLSNDSPNWHVNTSQGECLVRTGEYKGFACEEENLEVLLDLKLAEEPQDQTISFTHSHLPMQQLLENNITQITTISFINLLQHRYQPKPKATKIKKIWQLAGLSGIACILLILLTDIVSLFILQHKSHALETQINTIYQRNFPQAKTLVAPKERMTDKLRRLSSSSHQNNFLLLLAKLAKSLKEAPGVRIQNLEFRDQQLTLETTSASFDNLDGFTKSLSGQMLSVKQQNSAAEGSQVKATLIIREGA